MLPWQPHLVLQQDPLLSESTDNFMELINRFVPYPDYYCIIIIKMFYTVDVDYPVEREIELLLGQRLMIMTQLTTPLTRITQ